MTVTLYYFIKMPLRPKSLSKWSKFKSRNVEKTKELLHNGPRTSTKYLSCRCAANVGLCWLLLDVSCLLTLKCKNEKRHHRRYLLVLTVYAIVNDLNFGQNFQASENFEIKVLKIKIILWLILCILNSKDTNDVNIFSVHIIYVLSITVLYIFF